jgi:hypothetical protein
VTTTSQFFFMVRRKLNVLNWESSDFLVYNDDGTELALDPGTVCAEAEVARGKLHGLALLAFFGLGLGPARFGEIFRMDRRSMCYEHGYVRYATVSVKKGSTFAAGFRNTERRLPRSLSRFAVVYAALLGDRGCGYFFGSADRSHAAESQMGILCRRVVQDLMLLDDVPTLLDIRKFFASVSNVVFPNGIDTLLSSEIAEQAGHARLTHSVSYRTDRVGGMDLLHKKNSLAFGEGVLQQGKEAPEVSLPMGESEAESAIKLVS